MPRTLGRRLLGAAVAATAVAISSPAYAAAPQIVVLLPDATVAAGGSTAVAPHFAAERAVILTHVKVTFQLSGGLAGVAFESSDGTASVRPATPPRPRPDCTLDSPTSVSCALPYGLEIGTSGEGLISWGVGLAATKAALGKTGKLTVTLAADGIDPVKKTVDVNVAEGVDLAAGKDTFISVKPGADFTTELQVRNTSKSVVHGVSVLLGTDPAYQSKQQFGNCFYDGDRLNVCTFAQDLEPGTTYRLSVPYRLRPDTVAPSLAGGVFEWLTAGDWDDLIKFLKEIGRDEPGTPGNGDTLSLRRVATSKGFKQTDPNLENNFQSQSIDVDGKMGPDLSAVGATVSGAAGTTVTMPVGVKNNGQGDVNLGPGGYPAAAALITIPAGATVTSYPDACGPNSKDILKGDPNRVQYACFTGPLLTAGAIVTWKFALKIDKAVTNATGSVQINPESDIPLYRDGNKANDTAEIVLNSTGATNPGGGHNDPGHNDVGLPITGPQTALFGAAGAALLAAGFAVFAVSRRRRTRFEA